jgi:iron complex outermembrane recepter protein
LFPTFFVRGWLPLFIFCLKFNLHFGSDFDISFRLVMFSVSSKFLFLHVILIFLCQFGVAANAQVDTSKVSCKNVLSGSILDNHDNSILSDATIIVVELNINTVSDKSGLYQFSGICDGQYTIKISHYGCVAITQLVIVKGNTIQNFYPEHHIETIDDVAVIAERAKQQSTQTTNDVSQEKLSQSKGLSLGESLKNIAGVTTLTTGNSISKPIIHGLHSNRILILNNGVRQEGQQWGVEHAPEIDPFTAGNLSVMKGASAVRYGSDAIAGVILVEPKTMRVLPGLNGEINTVGMTNGGAGTISAYLDGNFKKLSSLMWRIQGTLKQSGTASAPRYIMVNTGFKETNFSYNLVWKKQKYGAEIFYSQFNTKLGIFGASHIGNLTDLEKAFKSTIPIETGSFTYNIKRPYQQVEHELFKSKVYVRTGLKSKVSVVYARQYNKRLEYDKSPPLNDSLESLNKPDLQFELTTHTVDLIWEHDPMHNFSGSIGINGITQGNTYEGRALIPNFRSHAAGVFAIERLKIKRLELEAGIRYDYKWLRIYKYEFIANEGYTLISPIREFKNVSGNVGAIFKIDSTFNFAVNFGSAWRAPSVSELHSNGLHHGAAAIEYGDKNLKIENAYTSIFTVKYTPRANLFIEVSPYYNYFSNFIYREPTAEPILTIRGAFPGFNYQQADVRMAGCDFYLNYKFSKSLEIISKASILRARNKTQDNWLIMMPSDRYDNELIYRFKKWKSLSNAYVSFSAQHILKQWRVDQNVDFAPPPPAYYLFNMHLSSSVLIKKQKIEIGISVFNLFNTSYRDYLDRFRYFTDAVGRNISFRLKVPLNINFKK